MHCPRRRSPERRAPRGHALVQAALRSRVRAEAAATAAQVRASVRGGPPASLPSAAQYSACLCASTRGNTPRLARRCADAERTTCPNRPTRSRPKTGRRESRPIRIILRGSTEYSSAAGECREVQLAKRKPRTANGIGKDRRISPASRVGPTGTACDLRTNTEPRTPTDKRRTLLATRGRPRRAVPKSTVQQSTHNCHVPRFPRSHRTPLTALRRPPITWWARRANHAARKSASESSSTSSSAWCGRMV
jgi:hypothetical protein